MARGGGSGVLTAQKCPHFDISKAPFPETFLSAYKKIKFASTMETLKPSAKATINKLAGLKVGEERLKDLFSQCSHVLGVRR